ncbi:DAK2 domain-containing protein [Nocardioides marmorisolisilvae]|uniref:DAK2 domain-containing protein n=1 Tax=Nocardioides marmorisolisilvae TaxID=1542737 RepID=A0A3N0DWP8_9ACTN|nr:DAK2 domain-containing protein [Nocardioides marmorisolisilvae]RNL79873.1 DAK2 domain-containing protein [Nocardioides marmorisolisilvae]
MSTGTRGEAIATFDLGAVRRFADLAVEGLSAAREEIDALNVYPVPDGDTGTNMFLTMESAREALRDHLAAAPAGEEPDLGPALHVYAKAALLGARGNSGVILSQLIGALFKRMGQGGPDDRSASLMAEGFAMATEAAYAAVGNPVEGTMLTVARDAAGAAARVAADPETHLGDVLKAAAAEAREALARTPDQMQLLRDAGVVDAGGAGLCVILDAAATAVTGQRSTDAPQPMAARKASQLPTGDLTEDGPAYEVMYLLDVEEETESEAIGALRARLTELGDSLVVVGGDGLWNVHVHTDDVGAAVEAGIDVGRPRRIRVTHFAEQVTRARGRRAERRGRAVVAVVAGEGLAAIFREAGAHVLVGGPGRRPSTGEILDLVHGCGAEEVVVLPNDPDTIRAAEAAAAEADGAGDVRVVVIPTKAQVQGIAALAVHEPGRSFDADVVQMTSAARGARHGAVTVAVKQAITTAGACEPGDVLGVLMGDFAIVGTDLFEVTTAILERLLSAGGELVTLVSGEGAGDLVSRCEDWIEAHHTGVDVLVYDGGQERYPLLLAVE